MNFQIPRKKTILLVALVLAFTGGIWLIRPFPSSLQSHIRTGDPESVSVLWSITNPDDASQTHPAVSYDPLRDQVLLVWEDGRNDLLDRVDYYGFEANSDIFAQRFDVHGAPHGDLIEVASDRDFPPGSQRYDNEQWPSVHFDRAADSHVISYMTIPDDVLEVGDMRTSTCYNIDLRAFENDTATLSPIVRDLARYTAPEDLLSPWNTRYDWSCQQEPASISLGENINLVAWHDGRERFSEVDGRIVAKDIYAQVVIGDQVQRESAILISHHPSQASQRLPFIQEQPAIAGADGQYLIVWEDERRGNVSQAEGFRDIVGRYIGYGDGGLTLGDEVSIALGEEGSSVSDFKHINPAVAYVPQHHAFVVVWSAIYNYQDEAADVAYLMLAVLDLDGKYLRLPEIIPHTRARQAHAHEIACADDRCLLVYRKGEDTTRFYANLMTGDWRFDQEILLDATPEHHAYPAVVVGRTDDNEVDFYSAYVVVNRVHLARIRTSVTMPTATATFTSTPTRTPTSTVTSSTTPTPTPTPTPSPTPTPTPTFTATPTPSLTATSTATAPSVPTQTPTPPRYQIWLPHILQ